MRYGQMLITHADGSRQTIALHDGSLRIGSAPDNDLVLAQPGIAPHHAVIGCDDQDDLLIRFVVCDRAGARLEIALPRSFAPAAIVRIGGCLLSYKPASERATHPIARITHAGPALHAPDDEGELLSSLLQRERARPAERETQLDPHEAITMEMPMVRDVQFAE